MKNPLSKELYHSRANPRKPDLRGDFFRDQTAIIHATPFRRLKHKTQVFFSPQNDHICTRIEHVLHVSTIATTLCKGLDLDVELAQAIALGHDLGHAPFGHAGEKMLNDFATEIGGFVHEVHGLRVVDKITRNGKGLNLTWAVRDGIVSHCGEDFRQSIQPMGEAKDLDHIQTRQPAPCTYEGCVVRIADKIAYLGRDIEDAITAGIITIQDVPSYLRKNLGSTNGEIIDTLVLDVVQTSAGTETVGYSEEKFNLLCQLKDFNYEYIYNHQILIDSDKSIRILLGNLLQHLLDLFEQYGLDEKAYKKSPLRLDQHFGEFIKERQMLYRMESHPRRCVVDFVAGMSDIYAIETATQLLQPSQIGNY